MVELDVRYVLITPLKNEEKTISKVIESVKEQSIKPFIWVIVNDGSTDKSQPILEEKTKNISWIYIVNKVINKEYDWLGYAKVINEGISNLKPETQFDYLGILDSDITVEKDYFKKLLLELEKDKNMGVISGEIYVLKNSEWVAEREKEYMPRGGARLYNYKVLNEIGGFPYTPSPDSISNIKILNRGYSVKKLKDTKAYQHRETFARRGRLKGYFVFGRSRYVLSYFPTHVIVISIKIGIEKKPYILSGVAYLLGYLTGFFSRDNRINDDEIRAYSRAFWKRIFKFQLKN